MKTLKIKTRKEREVFDITDKVNERIEAENLQSGFVFLFILHTTASLTTADLDPGTDQDMIDAFEAIMPRLKYRHPHDPGHVTDHILSSVIGPSLVLPVRDGELVLGTWQRVVLIEMSGPREREIIFSGMPARD
jgi:secondary thiamine-phosphate synthase enzyme